MIVFLLNLRRKPGWLFRAVLTNAEFCVSEYFSESLAVGVSCLLRSPENNQWNKQTSKLFRLTVKANNCSRF